ncbi:MAG: hypothetical protein LKI94_05425 [Sporolactobacillus sp.]|jgi:hypothetical protein|nr:hypothetical protein [Sporolactobacillus sp.]
MSGRKKLFWLIAAALLAFVGWRIYGIWWSAQDHPSWYHARDRNPAKALTIETPADLTVGSKRFPEGFYDLTIERGTVDTDVGTLKQGQMLRNYFFHEQTTVNFGGKGRIKLTPARFTQLTFKNNRYPLKNQYGNFTAGKELPAGNYNVAFICRSPQAELMVQTFVSDNEINETHYLKSGKSIAVSLKRSATLQLIPNVHANDDFHIVISRVGRR